MKSAPVISNSDIEITNMAISLPSKVVTDDGREIALTSWIPSVETGELVTVTLTGIIKIESEA